MIILIADGNLGKVRPVTMEELWQVFYYSKKRAQSKPPSDIDVVM